MIPLSDRIVAFALAATTHLVVPFAFGFSVAIAFGQEPTHGMVYALMGLLTMEAYYRHLRDLRGAR